MRRAAFTLLLLAGWLPGMAQDEYTGRYLYAEVDPTHGGGIRFTLAADAPVPEVAVAVGQRSRTPYAGKISGRTVSFLHLPVDKYDLVLATPEAFYEGLRLVPAADPEATKVSHDEVAAEIAKIEGFFDRKEIHRLEVEKTLAGTLVQQWRAGPAVKQSGEAVKGVIHSLDLIWFERPLKGWQLVKRRQIYREELATGEPLAHHFSKALSTIRVIDTVKELGTLDLP